MDFTKLIKDFHDNHPDKTLIYLYMAGSHFFDLNTPDSDLDIRGIYLPKPDVYKAQSKSLVKFQSNTKGQNTKDDLDLDIFSLPFFFTLLAKGDFNMMEALYAPQDKIILESPLMSEIKSIRKSLLVKDISAFFGFFKREYRQHSINHGFYETRLDFYNFLKPIQERIDLKLKNKEFIEGSEIRLDGYKKELEEFMKGREDFKLSTTPVIKTVTYQKVIEFALHQYPLRARISYIMEQLKTHIDGASHRKKDRKAYKGLSHCLRLLYQAQDLLSEGKFNFPFDSARHKILLDAKNGLLSDEELRDIIEKEKEKTQILDKNSSHDKHAINIIEKLSNNLEARMGITSLLDKKS